MILNLLKKRLASLWSLDDHVEGAVDGRILLGRICRLDPLIKQCKKTEHTQQTSNSFSAANVLTIEIDRKFRSDTIVKDDIVIFDKLSRTSRND